MALSRVTSRSYLSLGDRAAKPPDGVPKGEALERATKREVAELGRLQSMLYADKRYALLVVLQGRDASGKDGTIKHVFDGCDPQGCRVTSFGVPTDVELSHDYLWRVHGVVPPRGMIGIFNRSHYEDVLVVRVKELVPRGVWSRRYDQINDFERMLTLNGVVILKFFLHISRDEQREQLIERLEDPTKNWKFRAGDLKERARWDAYTRAYRDALRRCSTPWAPWFVVPSDKKAVRNYLVTSTITAALRKLRLRYPRAPREVLDLAKTIV
jgi:PPK2 family polyphosphate:nucleotide phosphotransferase